MKITLSPQRRDDNLAVIKNGDTLTINGVEYDFSKLPDGGTLPNEAIECEWIISDVDRIDGEIELTLLMPNGANASENARFPKPIINHPDGQLELPK